MLRPFQLRKQAVKPFVCWQCLSRLHQQSSYNGRVGSSSNAEKYNSRHLRRLSGAEHARSATSFASANASGAADSFPFPTLPIDTDIRRQLRQWEKENAGSFVPVQMPSENLDRMGGIVNNGQHQDQFVDIDSDPSRDDGDYMPLFERDELVDVGAKRTFLLPGDLVELSFLGGQGQELAIFIRELESQGQYYTMSGRWANRLMSEPKFFVPGFVQPHELEDILPYLPGNDVPKSMQDKLQQFAQSLPRNVGRTVVNKMTKFWDQVDITYLAAASRLEKAHELVATKKNPTYLTLEEIADIVLDPVIKKQSDGTYSKPALYAVHRAILSTPIGFQAQPKGTLRSGGRYEVRSLSEARNVAWAVDCVRAYTEKITIGGKPHRSWEYLHVFIQKCKRLIDKSREDREFTPYGTLGPSSRKPDPDNHWRKGSPGEPFTDTDEILLRFIESWACLSSFNRGSGLNAIASAILRAVGRYDDVQLTQKTGYTFLQEIGAIPPWESLSSFALRLPFTGRRLRSRDPVDLKGFTKDKLADIRKDWGELPVYCIDDASALEIDDGISIEATETPDEYWAHIHVADPSSHLDPNDTYSKNFERIVSNVYHPDRVFFMIDPHFVNAELSLARARPCLTFSARMNLSGELLEHKVSAGIIRNVTYTSPSVFEAVASESPRIVENADEVVHVVGSGTTSGPTPAREMTTIDQLSNEQRSQLKLLHQIGAAHAKKLRSRGGIMQGPSSFNISAGFDGAEWERLYGNNSMRYDGDPTIKLSIPEAKTRSTGGLTYLMLLANEVGARWCSDRGIPVPYRVTPLNPAKEDPAEYYANVLVPSRNEEGVAPMEIARHYFDLVGPAQLSLTPGPHMTVGAEMITKCTSPLRRFPDFLVHAQIGATLLEEARLGKSLVGNTSEAFLPYSADRISVLLPRIDTRERMIKKADVDARRIWLSRFVLRAWRFKEAEIPSALTFVVRTIDPYKKIMMGTLEEFLAPAQCTIPDWMDPDTLQPNDKLDTEITDVDTYLGRIEVSPIAPDEAEQSED
ncbi:Mitochondrial protein cyt-4 [Lachnellula suecica]|uniref:Mitochondrial protein cyt-4 n=1 Tax=Lachnellula suecica TaxID=602035 RepID=A0A8T9C0P2_9HELO|nr:Mitochondrial protein cyt-4 [Lachnellula suecica]